MSNSRHWMQTYTKRPLKFDDLASAELHIIDIARPLSRLPRFGGHMSRPISVAEHCLVVSRLVITTSPLVQLHALMHDAHEAFTGDIVAPLKRFMAEVMNFDMTVLQGCIQNAIENALNIPPLEDSFALEEIHRADLYCCKLEREMAMASSLEWDIDHIETSFADHAQYQALTAEQAFRQFHSRFEQLMVEIDANS